MAPGELSALFARHEDRVAFQLSCGRDSITALYLLKPYWGRMHVYYLDTDDAFPEVKEILQRLHRDVQIDVVQSSSPDVRELFGMPTDLLPADNTPMGRLLAGESMPLIGRFECCSRSIMQPLHDRMKRDGMTLLIRGTRREDFKTQHEFMSGHVSDGVELYLPIEDWTSAQVDTFLRNHGLPRARFYLEGMTKTPDCMGCTAWWGEGRMQYMARFHPQALRGVQRDVIKIREHINHQLAKLDTEENHG